MEKHPQQVKISLKWRLCQKSKSGFSPTRRHNNPWHIVYLTIEHQKHLKKLLELSRENRWIPYGTESLGQEMARSRHQSWNTSAIPAQRGQRQEDYEFYAPGLHSEFQANVKSLSRKTQELGNAAFLVSEKSGAGECSLEAEHLPSLHKDSGSDPLCVHTRMQHSTWVQQKVSADVCSLAPRPQSAWGSWHQKIEFSEETWNVHRR